MNRVEDTLRILKDRCEVAGTLLPDFNLLMNSSLKSRLLKIITESFHSLIIGKVISDEFLLENFTEKDLSDAGVFVRGSHSTYCGTVMVCGDATVFCSIDAIVESYDNSKVIAISSKINAYDSSMVEVVGDSFVNAHNDSSVKTRLGNSVVIAFDNSTVNATGQTIVYNYSKNKFTPMDSVIIRAANSNIIYVKKGAIEIVEE